MNLTEFKKVLWEKKSIEISSEELQKVEESYRFLKVFSKDKVIYGINTGFGPMASYHIEEGDLINLQYNIIRSHSCGAGEPLPSLWVKAALICEGAFSECTKLSSIKIPETVTRIEDKCFYLCDSLESITVDEYNTHYRTLNGVLFNYKTTLLHSYPTAKKDSVYTIPESITEIASWAFRGCEYISKVIFPAKLQKIREQAFENCLSLKDVYFQCDEPPSVGLQAFYNCPINLKIFYPEGNEDLWGTLWHGYKALTWNPDLPQGTPTRRGPLEQILKIFK